jgi:hypothetical protein
MSKYAKARATLATANEIAEEHSHVDNSHVGWLVASDTMNNGPPMRTSPAKPRINMVALLLHTS